MPARDGVTFETRALDRLIAQFSDRAERMIATEAMEITAGAIANTTRVDTGTMRRGWRAVKVERLRWRVGNSVFYAVFHEFGTSRLAASPMLGPAIEAVRRARPGRVRALFHR